MLDLTHVDGAGVGLAGIMGNKAMLMINGGEPQAVPVGQTLGGVKVLSVQGDQAVIEIGGKSVRCGLVSTPSAVEAAMARARSS